MCARTDKQANSIKLETESQTQETVQNQSVCFKSQPGAKYQYWNCTRQPAQVQNLHQAVILYQFKFVFSDTLNLEWKPFFKSIIFIAPRTCIIQYKVS